MTGKRHLNKLNRQMTIYESEDPAPDTPEWYDMFVEKPIQPLVRLFRENGFRTTESCGHLPAPYVQVTWDLPHTPLLIDQMLKKNGYAKYKISAMIDRRRPSSFYIYVRTEFYTTRHFADMENFKNADGN